jgi:hypothetical protein
MLVLSVPLSVFVKIFAVFLTTVFVSIAKAIVMRSV